MYYQLCRLHTYKLNLAEVRHVYKHYKCNSMRFSWFERSRCELLDDGDITLKDVGELLNCTIMCIVCAFFWF